MQDEASFVDDSAPEAASRAQVRRGLRRVFVHDLELIASVGIYEIEKRYEQRIIVSVDLDVADDYDGISDRIEDVLDYGEVVGGLTRIAGAGHVNLIETLAERMAAECLSDTRVARVRLRIVKPDIMPSCRSVGIEIERRRG